MSDHTPTTDEVRDLFVYGAWERARNGCDDDENGAEFDRWLAEHDRQVKASAWAEGVHFVAEEASYPDPYDARSDARYQENPYRVAGEPIPLADRIRVGHVAPAPTDPRWYDSAGYDPAVTDLVTPLSADEVRHE